MRKGVSKSFTVLTVTAIALILGNIETTYMPIVYAEEIEEINQTDNPIDTDENHLLLSQHRHIPYGSVDPWSSAQWQD